MIVPEVVGGNPIPSENWFRSSTTSLRKGWGDEEGGGVERGGERDGKE